LSSIPIVENDGLHSMSEKSGSIYLKAGRHPIRVEWFNRTDKYGLEVTYEGPDLPRQKIPDSVLFRVQVDFATGVTNFLNGLNYRCYQGLWWSLLPNFSHLAAIKTGITSNFDLSVKTRDEQVGLQFNGYVQIAKEGLFKFYTKSDDGSRLFIDDSSAHGLPMVRALFREFPDASGPGNVDDEYLYGASIPVAPLLHENETARDVYLPPGTWIDYQAGKDYSGGWQKIAAGKIPEIILVRAGTAIPHLALAQSTAQMDWVKIDLSVYVKDAAPATGSVFLPGDTELHELTLTKAGDGFKLNADPPTGQVAWEISDGKNH